MDHILSIVTFLPLVGAAAITLLRFMARADDKQVIERNAKWIALWTTLATFAVSIALVAIFDHGKAGYQFEEYYTWFAGASYHMGVDGISILFVLLTAF